MEDGFARQVSMDTWRPIGGVIPFFDRAICAFAEWDVAASHSIHSIRRPPVPRLHARDAPHLLYRRRSAARFNTPVTCGCFNAIA